DLPYRCVASLLLRRHNRAATGRAEQGRSPQALASTRTTRQGSPLGPDHPPSARRVHYDVRPTAFAVRARSRAAGQIRPADMLNPRFRGPIAATLQGHPPGVAQLASSLVPTALIV